MTKLFPMWIAYQHQHPFICPHMGTFHLAGRPRSRWPVQEHDAQSIASILSTDVHGPGRERRSARIDLVCNDSAGFEIYYRAAEAEAKQIGAQPHLGKFCEHFDRSDLAQLHQENFARFRQLKEKHDPEGKFINSFTERLFGS